MQNIWLFSFLNFVDADATQRLATKLKAMLEGWNAHGTPVQSKVYFRYGHFLFIEAITDVSGCSIDWLHRGLLELFESEGLTLADSSRIFFWNAQEEIDSIDFRELEAALVNGKLQAGTRVFDPQAVQQGDFDRWEARLADTWMARYLPENAV